MKRVDQNKICYFAQTNHRKINEEFGIYLKDRLHHFYILGRTGTGKTNLMDLQQKTGQKDKSLCC